MYSRACTVPDARKTVHGIASAVVNHDTPMPKKIKLIEKELNSWRDKMYKDSPESEPRVFTDIFDERNDCRTIDTALYDILKAVLQGRTVRAKSK